MAEPGDADILDAVIELTNILSSTIISRLSEELGTKVQFFPPSTDMISGNHLIGDEDMLNYHQIIVVSTVMEFQSHEIKGQILILTKDAMIENLRRLIDQKLEELYA